MVDDWEEDGAGEASTIVQGAVTEVKPQADAPMVAGEESKNMISE